MAPVVYPFSRPTEAAFKGEAVEQVKFPPHDHPGSALTAFLDLE